MFDVVRPRRSRGFSFGCGSQGKNTIKAYISNRNGYDSNLISFVFKLMVSMVVNLPFSGPPFLSFCLDTKGPKSQGCIHFLTLKSIQKS